MQFFLGGLYFKEPCRGAPIGMSACESFLATEKLISWPALQKTRSRIALETELCIYFCI
jgi:hypothetical protein